MSSEFEVTIYFERSYPEKFKEEMVENCYISVNSRIVFKTNKLFKIGNKDKLPTHNNSNVIYKFVFSCKQTYVGSTSNKLINRVQSALS